MKNLRNNLSLLLLIIFVGNFNGLAQTSVKDVKGAKDVKKEARDQVSNTKEAADKSATSVSELGEDERNKFKEKISQANTEEERQKVKEEIKSYKEEKKRYEESVKSDANKKASDTREDLSTSKGSYDKELNAYKEKLKTASPDERKKLEVKIAELEKQGAVVKKQVKKGDKELKKKGNNKKEGAYSDLKGRALGNAKATDARKMIEKKKSDLAKRDGYVASSRDRVSTAKAKVNADLASDAITKEQAADKFTKIAKVEKSLNDYETKLKDSRQKLTDRSNTVADYIKN